MVIGYGVTAKAKVVDNKVEIPIGNTIFIFTGIPDDIAQITLNVNGDLILLENRCE